MEPTGAGVADGRTERALIVRDATWYTSATYLSQLLAFGIGVAAKRMLGPTDLGVWAVLLSLLSFLALLEFGVTQATNKQMAYALSKGDDALAEEYKRVQFTFVTATALLGALGVAAYVLLNRAALGTTFARGLLCLAFILPLYQVHMGQVTVFWANKRFSGASLVTLLDTVLMGTIGLLLIWRVGVYGQILAYLIVLLAKLGFLDRQAAGQARMRVRFGWNSTLLRELLRVGVPLQVIALVNLVKLSGTSLLVAYYLDTTAVGYYALALSIQNYIYWTPNAFSIVMFPRFQERMAGSNDDPTALLSYLVKPTVGLALFVLPVLISGSYFLVPVLIRHALPAYEPSITVLKVLLAGTYFLSMEHMPGQLLTTTNHLWARVALAIATLVGLAACVAAAVWQRPTLLAIVAAVAVGNAIGFFLNFMFAHSVVDGARVDRWLSARLLGAFAYLMLVLVGLDRLLSPGGGEWWRDAAASTAAWAAALCLLAPLFILAERQLSLIAGIRGFVVAKTRGAARAG